MSRDLRSITDEENYEYDDRNLQSASTTGCQIFKMVNVPQLQIDLRIQHEHPKDALTELNQRAHVFVDRVQQLQSENSKYIAEIVKLRRHLSSFSDIDVSWDEHYHSLNSNLSMLDHEEIDFDSDFELCQLEIGLYQLLIEIKQQREDKPILALEQELKQSASQLNSLRTSYTELGREIEGIHAECEDLIKRYLSLAYEWCNLMTQRKHWNQTLEALKREIAFYKNIRSYSVQDRQVKLF